MLLVKISSLLISSELYLSSFWLSSSSEEGCSGPLSEEDEGNRSSVTGFAFSEFLSLMLSASP